MSATEKVERKGQKARANALNRLLTKYSEEWEALLAEERKAVGLLPKIKRKTIAELEAELAAARAEITKLSGNSQP